MVLTGQPTPKKLHRSISRIHQVAPMCTPSDTDTWFPGPMKVCSTKQHLDGSAIFTGLMVMTNTHTHHRTLRHAGLHTGIAQI